MIRKFTTALLVAFLFAVSAKAQSNVTFRSNLPFPGALSNIGGYVDNLGNEYALVGWSSGLTIVNVTNPDTPVVVQTIGGINSNWREVKVWSHYAYVTTEGCCSGLQIIDLSNLPGQVTSKYWTGSGAIVGLLETIHALHIDNNGFCYLFGSNLFSGTAIIIDLADPWNPTYAGRLPIGSTYVHDGFAYNDTLYSCHIYDGYFAIWNVANKSNPILLGTQTTPGAFTHNAWLNDQGTALFTTDEVNDSYLTSYDITNPGNIKELDRIQVTPGSQSIVHNTHTLNNFEIVSWYKDGIAIVDVARPGNMIVTGYYDTYTQGAGGGFSGCWGVYPFLPSGTVVASDINNGLFVLTPDYIRGCYLEGIVTDSLSGTPVNGVIVTIVGQNVTKNTNLTGEYKTGLANAGTFNVTFQKAGYYPKSVNGISLSNGVLTQLDVQLVPVVTVTQTGNVINQQGNPVPNAQLTFNGPLVSTSATADANGQFTINGFIPDTYTVVAGSWGYLTSCQSQNVNGSPITIVLSNGYYDDFTLDFNWTVSGQSANLWERANPVATFNNADPANPGADVPGDCGVEAMVTDNGGGGAWDHDVDFGSTILTSPVFDATLYNDPIIHYSRWYYNGGTTNGAPNDTMKVYLSNGLATVLVETADPSTIDNGTWVDKLYHINQLLTPTNSMQFSIQVRDSAPVSNIVEGGLDLFYITEGTVAVNETNPAITISARPNPFKDEITVDYLLNAADLPAEIVFTDIEGRIVGTQLINFTSGSLKIGDNWSPGIYFAKLNSRSGTKSLLMSKTEK